MHLGRGLRIAAMIGNGGSKLCTSLNNSPEIIKAAKDSNLSIGGYGVMMSAA